MCNAWNHPEGCECGFGPPYHGSGIVTPGERLTWLEYVVKNRNFKYLRATQKDLVDDIESISSEMEDAKKNNEA
jgi:hypothetical protein